MTFEDWFYEPENFGLRSERFYDTLASINTNGDYIPGDITYQNVVMWLKAAYNVGQAHAYDQLMDDGK